MIELKPIVKTAIKVKSEQIQTALPTGIKTFTSVEPYYTEKKPNPHHGIKATYTLAEISTLLNSLEPSEKFEAPAILKGIFNKGTSGVHCVLGGIFLPFDLDVKTTENAILNSDQVLNDKVFIELQKIGALTWRSNSGKGIAGFLYVPSLSNIKYKQNTLLHNNIADAIYSNIEAIILKALNVKIKFDRAQGKFRQIRFLAQQNEPREINYKPLFFSFTLSEVKEKTSQGVPLYQTPRHIRSGEIKEQFNRDNKITDVLQNCGLSLVGNRVKYHKSQSTTCGFINHEDNVLVNFSGSLSSDVQSRKVKLSPFDLMLGLNFQGQYYKFIDHLKEKGYKDITPKRNEVKTTLNQLKTALSSDIEKEAKIQLIFLDCIKLKTLQTPEKLRFLKDVNPARDFVPYFYEYLGLNKISDVIYSKSFKAKKWVSEVLEDVIKLTETHQQIILKAETGTGKTTAILKDFRKKHPDARCLFLAPLTIIVNQLKAEYKSKGIEFLTGSSEQHEHTKARDSKFIVATYEQGIKHLKDQNFDYIFIDEAHQLILSNSYKDDVIKALTDQLCQNDTKVIGLTATPNRLFNDVGFTLVNIDFESTIKTPIEVRYSNLNAFDIVLNHIEANTSINPRFLFRINDKAINVQIKEQLIKNGTFKKGEIVILNSNQDIKKGVNFKLLAESSKFRKDVKVVLTTSIIDEGLSIKDHFTDSVFINTDHQPQAEPIKQFFARFRSSETFYKNDKLFEVDSRITNYLYLKQTKEKKPDVNFSISNDFKTKLQELESENFTDYNTEIVTPYNDFSDAKKFFYKDAEINKYYLANHVLQTFYTCINESQFLHYLKLNFNIETTTNLLFLNDKKANDFKPDTKSIKTRLTDLFINDLNLIKQTIKHQSSDLKLKAEIDRQSSELKLKNEMHDDAEVKTKFHFFDLDYYLDLYKDRIQGQTDSELELKEFLELEIKEKHKTEEYYFRKFLKNNLQRIEKYYYKFLTLEFLEQPLQTILDKDKVFLSDVKINAKIGALKIEKTLSTGGNEYESKRANKINNVLNELAKKERFSLNDFKKLLKKNRVLNFDKYNHTAVKTLLEYLGLNFKFCTREKEYKKLQKK